MAPSLLPLKLIKVPSKDTEVEFLTALHAEPTSIMESSLLDMETRMVKNSGSWRTAGVEAGEKMVTSESLMLLGKVSAVSTWPQSNLPQTEYLYLYIGIPILQIKQRSNDYL